MTMMKTTMMKMTMMKTVNRVVKRAKELLSNREILEIDIRKAVRFTHRNTNKNKNDKKYIKWLIYFLDNYHKNDATVVYANEEVCDYLQKYLTPMTWLSYSPAPDNSLKSNEVMVGLNVYR